MPRTHKKRGTGSMDESKQREVSRKGGKSKSHKSKSHDKNIVEKAEEFVGF